MCRRQEAKQFDPFTPKASRWYFDIREGQYGWIKPENTVNVDEGGIMTGFGKHLPLLLIADWYYITSPNGWTEDHIGIEWLKRVYLPQIMPTDNSDARFIILDGYGSHAIVNFIRAYAKARRVGMTKKNILSGWKVTGNWLISRSKALQHPEIREDRPNGSPRAAPEPRPYFDSDDTQQTSRQIRDLGLNKAPKTRRRYNVIAKGFDAQRQTVAGHTLRIAGLEEELARLKKREEGEGGAES
ncbi:hypothetical protein FOXB_02094 [Fusarium oxysporum f. sp. conglutinans Fo5176]|uniref:DDE-1 domain-containing protein n=1 Tax=Fusarium oxysporum (strain Fo5176) TaxID=660025 RepID=F9F6R9_FUSOF|nr:hypothetical protein FOXB_02094 [Fusarium oxysporum f. sp. conglutinans Fo5176]